ncbi:hypothetical protein Peur_049600 [Populus x canadensis]
MPHYKLGPEHPSSQWGFIWGDSKQSRKIRMENYLPAEEHRVRNLNEVSLGCCDERRGIMG